MGLDDNRFVVQIDEEFRCSICRDIIEDPIASYCEHVFCKTCINEWLQKEPSCPVDRKPLKVHHLCETSRFFRNFYLNLELKCEFEWNGCQKVCKIKDLESHQNKCEFNPNVKYECSKGCNALITRSEAQTHSCVEYLKMITDIQNKELLKMNEREYEYNKKVMSLENIIQSKNDEINELQQKICLKQIQKSESTSCSSALMNLSFPSTSGHITNYENIEFNLLLIGDSGVGKSSLISRFIDNSFTTSYISDIKGSRSHTIELNRETILLKIWDDCKEYINRKVLKDANGILFVYDVNDWKTFKNLNHWLRVVNRFASNDVKSIIVGNKCDSINKKCVDYLSALNFSRNCGIPLVETSAMTGADVEEVFYRVVSQPFIKRRGFRPLTSKSN